MKLLSLLLAPVLGLILAGIALPAHAVETFSYGTDPDQTIDVYRDPSPAWVAVVHGGSWAAGSKANTDATARKLQAAGFTVFNVEYRKTTDYAGNPGVPWADQRNDIVAALDWIHDNADQFGIDPGRGAIYGFSAGGHLAASAGLYGGGRARVQAIVSASGVLQPHRVIDVANSDPDVGWAGDKPTAENRTVAAWEAAAMRCPNIAWTDCSARWADFKPETHISADDPPIFMTQGTADPGVPPGTPRAFRYWMQRAGLEAVLIECVNWTHTEACAFDGGARQQQLVTWLRTKTA